MLLPSLKKGQEVRGRSTESAEPDGNQDLINLFVQNGWNAAAPAADSPRGTKNRGRRPPSRQNPRPKTRARATKWPGRPNRVARGGK